MNAPVRYDLWQKRRASIETKRNRKSITLDAFSAECGYQDNYSIYSRLSNSAYRATLTDALFDLTDQFTVEFWVKLLPSVTNIMFSRNTKTIFSIGKDSVGNLYAKHSGGLSVGTVPPTAEWFHVAVTADFAGEALLKVYLNGVLNSSATLTAAIAGGNTTINLGSISDSWIGYVSDLRIWDDIRTSEEIYQGRLVRANWALEPNLLAYFKCTEGSGLVIGDDLSALELAMNVKLLWSTTELWPFKFGASFVPAQWDITLPQKTSLKFPVSRPDGCTFMLCIRYVDDAGITHHKKMWDLDGVDIAPAPVMYAGEKLPLNFTLEAWNVDGAATIELPAALILYTGETTIPINDGDHASQIAMTPTNDTTLASNFPLTPFPIVFNTQQVY